MVKLFRRALDLVSRSQECGLLAGLLVWIGAGTAAWLRSKNGVWAIAAAIGFAVALLSLIGRFIFGRFSRAAEWLHGRTMPIRRLPNSPQSLAVLYLPPFRLDEQSGHPYQKFEEVLLERLTMPVVAVANPGAKHKVYAGARRVRLAGGDWRGPGRYLVIQAKLVLLVFSDSAGISEEVAMSVKLNALDRTALLLYQISDWEWAAALEFLPDAVMIQCLQHRMPTAAVVRDFGRNMRQRLGSNPWVPCHSDEGQKPREWRHVKYVPGLNLRAKNEGVVPDFRAAMRRARETLAVARENPRALTLEPIVHLAEAGCPNEMLLLIYTLVAERIAGLTFGGNFRLWPWPDSVLRHGVLVEQMMRFLIERTYPEQFASH